MRAGNLLTTLATALFVWSITLCIPAIAFGQQSAPVNPTVRDMLALAWKKGPADGTMGDKAKIGLPSGYMFIDSANTRRFLELNGNPPRDNHYTIAPTNLEWFAVLAFDSIGYVRDDEKVDPNAILKSLQNSDAPSNEERKRLGMGPIHTIGWHVAPHYEVETKRLEWAVKLRDETNTVFVNHSTRLLGRTGVMRAILVSDPDSLDQDIAAFRSVLKRFDFLPGERYQEFTTGDRVAQFGLAALVVGGAAAAAAKTGAGKAIGKFVIWIVVAGGIAVLAFLRRLFGRKKPT